LIEFWELVFWRKFQRRGVHVNIPKIGSRGGGNCLGEFLGVYAELRREFGRGNLKLEFFGVMFGGPRKGIEEGGQIVLLRVCFRGI
jgi:hypothetical protein